MKNLVLFYMSFFTCLSSYAVNFPFVGSLKSDGVSKNLECINFSGRWEGTCTFEDGMSSGTSPNELPIEMFNCNEAVINRISQKLNGVRTEVDSDDTSTQTMVRSLSWNNQSKKEFLIIKFNAEKTIFKGMQKHSLSGVGTMKVSGNKLTVEQKINNGGNNPTVSCSYTKP